MCSGRDNKAQATTVGLPCLKRPPGAITKASSLSRPKAVAVETPEAVPIKTPVKETPSRLFAVSSRSFICPGSMEPSAWQESADVLPPGDAPPRSDDEGEDGAPLVGAEPVTLKAYGSGPYTIAHDVGDDVSVASDGSYEESLNRCAKGLQRSAQETRLALKAESKSMDRHSEARWANDKMLVALKSARDQCSVVAADFEPTSPRRPTFGEASSWKRPSQEVAGAPSRKLIETSATQVMDPVSVMDPISPRSQTVAPLTPASDAHDHHEEEEELESSADEDVDVRYERHNVADVVSRVRDNMRKEGIEQPGSHQRQKGWLRPTLVNPAVEERKKLSAHSAEVRNFQDAMRTKFDRIRAEAGTDLPQSAPRFLQTTDPAHAVRDAVLRYHTQCEEIGRIYAEPGDAHDYDENMQDRDRKRLQHFVRDLGDISRR